MKTKVCNAQPHKNNEFMQAVYFQNLCFVQFKNVCVQYLYEQCIYRNRFPKCDNTDLETQEKEEEAS